MPQSTCKEIEEEKVFLYELNTFIVISITKTPVPGVNKFTILLDLSLHGHHYHTISFMPGCREGFKTNNAFSLYDIYGHAQHKLRFPPGGHESYNFGRHFLKSYKNI